MPTVPPLPRPSPSPAPPATRLDGYGLVALHSDLGRRVEVTLSVPLDPNDPASFVEFDLRNLTLPEGVHFPNAMSMPRAALRDFADALQAALRVADHYGVVLEPQAEAPAEGAL